jgi:hypothetical protein
VANLLLKIFNPWRTIRIWRHEALVARELILIAKRWGMTKERKHMSKFNKHDSAVMNTMKSLQ